MCDDVIELRFFGSTSVKERSVGRHFVGDVDVVVVSGPAFVPYTAKGLRLKAGEYFGRVELLGDFQGGDGRTFLVPGDSIAGEEPVLLSLFSGMTKPFSLERALRRRCSRSEGARSTAPL